MAHPGSLLRRAQKLERRATFTALLDEIRKRPLAPVERRRLLLTIMSKTASGEITPQEAKKLTSAIG
ncbi:hypothetical protein YTPLAS18_18050 [Nitrospira sp.]|nr:hypothetical protein YTPLAS18_18050 [Nitrospira sp.]